MSDMGILSSHFTQSTQLCQDLNEALIELKRIQYQMAGYDAVAPTQVQAMREMLLAAMNGVLAELKPDSVAPDAPRWDYPRGVIRHLERLHDNAPNFYQTDLVALQARLQQGDTLSESDFTLLDEMGRVLTYDAARAYRQIRGGTL